MTLEFENRRNFEAIFENTLEYESAAHVGATDKKSEVNKLRDTISLKRK